MQNLFLSLAAIFAAVFVSLNSSRYAAITLEGIKLWAFFVLPSLFPFVLISSLLSASGGVEKLSARLSPLTRRLYGTGGLSAYCRLISLLSGYPVGVKAVSDLRQASLIDADEASDYAVIASTSGPSFIIGCLGTAYGGYGGRLFLVHYLASLITGLILRPFAKSGVKSRELIKRSAPDLSDCVYSAVSALLLAGGFITAFFILSSILSDLKILLPLSKFFCLFLDERLANGLITGLIECSAGCKALSAVKTPLSLALASLVTAFGGLAVWAQSYSYLQKAGGSFKKFALSKLVQAALAFFIALPVFFLT